MIPAGRACVSWCRDTRPPAPPRPVTSSRWPGPVWPCSMGNCQLPGMYYRRVGTPLLLGRGGGGREVGRK